MGKYAKLGESNKSDFLQRNTSSFMAKILVVGSSNTDLVVKTERFPQPGETVVGRDFFLFQGGKGANQAVAAARMGGKVAFISRVGADLFGGQTKEALEREGISTAWMSMDASSPTGVAMITVNEQGENHIVVVPGANANLLPEALDEAQDVLLDSEVWLCQLEIPVETAAYLAEKAKSFLKKLILNPAPATDLPESVYQHLFLITPNETEASLLSGLPCEQEADYPRVAQWFLDKGVQQVVITLGEKGAFFKNAELELRIPAPPVTAIDTTAAGDVFNGTLAVALAEGQFWEKALQTAIQAASLSVTRMGAQASAPYRSELFPSPDLKTNP